jgi:hypothetical protein
MIELSPSQISGLKLAQQGDLHPRDAKSWTLENATVTYAKNDRWKERPQKIKSATLATITSLLTSGLLERTNCSDEATNDVYRITMAGKIWLLKNK